MCSEVRPMSSPEMTRTISITARSSIRTLHALFRIRHGSGIALIEQSLRRMIPLVKSADKDVLAQTCLYSSTDLAPLSSDSAQGVLTWLRHESFTATRYAAAAASSLSKVMYSTVSRFRLKSLMKYGGNVASRLNQDLEEKKISRRPI
ncbi:hypothetical protein MRB53_039165 [Persea americana]|nr:hypothetical protein MRB53_039165 [Persea americana]